MELQAALLCTAATVRDGLLSVIDAGRTELVSRDPPLDLDLRLALMVNCDLNFPLTLDLAPIALPAFGAYEVRVFLDEEWRAQLPFCAYQGG